MRAISGSESMGQVVSKCRAVRWVGRNQILIIHVEVGSAQWKASISLIIIKDYSLS